MMITDPRWTISIFLIYPRHNTTTLCLAHLRGHLDRLFILNTIIVHHVDKYLHMDRALGNLNVGFDVGNDKDEVI